MDNRTAPWTFVLDEPLRILVVDDDAILREFANVYLSAPSVAIDVACDGLEARTRLQEQHYDLLLLDIEMPRLDGFSLLEEIRSSEPLKKLPVIMLTGHDDIASIDRAYQLGANSFATKPVNWRQLSYQIRYVVRTPQAELQPALSHARPSSAITQPALLAFLRSVVEGADALAEQLTPEDRARYFEPLQGIRSAAACVLGESSNGESALAKQKPPSNAAA